jgi:hypothetical protein
MILLMIMFKTSKINPIYLLSYGLSDRINFWREYLSLTLLKGRHVQMIQNYIDGVLFYLKYFTTWFALLFLRSISPGMLQTVRNEDRGERNTKVFCNIFCS